MVRRAFGGTLLAAPYMLAAVQTNSSYYDIFIVDSVPLLNSRGVTLALLTKEMVFFLLVYFYFVTLFTFLT